MKGWGKPGLFCCTRLDNSREEDDNPIEDILDKFYVEIEVEVLNSDNIGEFCGSVLLSEDWWDKD